MSRRIITKLWIACMGHSGSTYLMDVMRAVGVSDPGEDREAKALVKLNERLIKTRFGRGNFFIDPLRPVGAALAPDVDGAALPATVLKDPRWSVTIHQWLGANLWPEFCLFTGRWVPEENTAAMLRGHDVMSEELWRHSLENSVQRIDNLWRAKLKMIARGVGTFWATFPATYEDERERMRLAIWLNRVFPEVVAHNWQEALTSCWNPSKVNVR